MLTNGETVLLRQRKPHLVRSIFSFIVTEGCSKFAHRLTQKRSKPVFPHRCCSMSRSEGMLIFLTFYYDCIAMLTKGTTNKLEITRHAAFQHVNKEHHIWNASQTRAGIFSKCLGFSYFWWKDAFPSFCRHALIFTDSSNDHSAAYSEPTKNLNACVARWMGPPSNSR